MPRALEIRAVNGGSAGAPATLTCELGQVRKEAAVAGVVCAGMSLVEPPPTYNPQRQIIRRKTARQTIPVINP